MHRIAARRHRPFSGEGARLFGGRWNSPGRPAIYCGDSFALAMLERLVHSATSKILPEDHWASALLPADAIEHVDAGGLTGWDAPDLLPSQSFGDGWLAEGRSLALSVPSVVTRIDRNIVLNPAHPRFAEVVVSDELPVVWDRRLFAR